MVQYGLVSSSDTLVLADLEFRLLDLDYLITLAPLHPSLACLVPSTHHPKPERHFIYRPHHTNRSHCLLHEDTSRLDHLPAIAQ